MHIGLYTGLQLIDSVNQWIYAETAYYTSVCVSAGRGGRSPVQWHATCYRFTIIDETLLTWVHTI